MKVSLQMQTILYHNSSGRNAFTGNLKQKEVHRAITLHPIKQHQHMYRVHNYMKVSKDLLKTPDWLAMAYPGIFFSVGGSTNSVEDRDNGVWGR